MVVIVAYVEYGQRVIAGLQIGLEFVSLTLCFLSLISRVSEVRSEGHVMYLTFQEEKAGA